MQPGDLGDEFNYASIEHKVVDNEKSLKSVLSKSMSSIEDSSVEKEVSEKQIKQVPVPILRQKAEETKEEQEFSIKPKRVEKKVTFNGKFT